MGHLKITAVILLGLIILSGCGEEKKDLQKEKVPQSELIRSEGTNVSALDINGDGKLYQCPMHFQVISDSLETCPLCMMDLVEYTVAEAGVNIQNHYNH